MSTETYANSPAKCCETCIFCRADNSAGFSLFDKCALYRNYCNNAIFECKLTHWRAKPPRRPRRSLRQWLYDILWA